MLLCGLCVNSLNILFWDLRVLLPRCLSSGDPGISLWNEGQPCFVYRNREAARGGGGWTAVSGPTVHPKLQLFGRRSLPGRYTKCTLKCWVRRQHQFQSLQNHRWSVRQETRRATLTGHQAPPPPRSLGLPLTRVQLPGLWADVIIVVFRAENRSSSQNGLLLQ